MRIVSSAVMWWGGASNRRAPSSMPVGYASQTGYQYDSISRVAGQREPAPPSKFSNEGGFRNSVLRGIGMNVLILPFRDTESGMGGYHSDTSGFCPKRRKSLSQHALARVEEQSFG